MRSFGCVQRVWRSWLISLLVVGVAGVFTAPAAWAAEPTQVTCAELPALFGTAAGKAVAGGVYQLPAGSCSKNIETTNPTAFTLEGASGGGTVLKPVDPTKPIIANTGGTTPVSLTLSGLTFTGEKEQAAVNLEAHSVTLTVTGDTFTENANPNGPAGLAIEQEEATSDPIVITNSSFAHNTGREGAGVQLFVNGPTTINANTFTADSALIAGGLELINFLASDNPISISGNLFGGASVAEGDIATEKGGGAIVEPASGQATTLTGNTFENDQIAGSGKGVSARQGAGLLLINSFGGTAYSATQSHNAFIDNVISELAPSSTLGADGAGEWASGIAVQSTDDTFIGNRITVDDDAPPEGAGLGVIASEELGSEAARPGTFVGTNDLFLDNTIAEGGWGGAIYVGGPFPSCTTNCPGSSIKLNDSTVVGNEATAGEGGAIWGSPDDVLAVSNSIITGNSPQPEIFGFAMTTPAFAFSDVCSEAGGPVVQSGAGNICADPRLEADGKETAASPTIDAGSNALVPSGLTADAFGATRIQSGHSFTPACTPGAVVGPTLAPPVVDMGASEFGPLALPAVAIACPPHSSPPPPGLTHFVRLKTNAKGAALTLSCSSTDGLGCSGTIFITTDELLHGKKIVAISLEGRTKVSVRLAQTTFSIAPGATATIQVKLNATGLKLLRRFHAFSTFLIANEASPTSDPFIFLFHTARFSEPKPKPKKHHPRRSKDPKHH